MNKLEKKKKREAIFKDKAVHPTTFHVEFTDEQIEALKTIKDNTISVLTGLPGTSKTLIACSGAFDSYVQNRMDRIIITRPTVQASRDLGFLPGDVTSPFEGKMAPYLVPILDALYKIRTKEEINKMIKDGKIDLVPIQFVRGRNFENCVVYCDEAQCLTKDELILLTTRICKNAKMIFTSDVNQIDLYNKQTSAGFAFDKIANLEGVGTYELKTNYRHELAQAIFKVLKD